MASLDESKFGRAVRKLPVVGQYQKDKAQKVAQDNWFSANRSDGYVEQEPTVWEWIKSIGPTRESALDYVADTFPCSKWLFNYNLQWFIGDLISGLTVGAVIIPQGMAYAKLARLPVEYGLYTSFFGGLVYWVFGTSKDINIGPVAVASILTGGILSEITHDFPDQSKQYIAQTIAMLAGAVVALIGILRLGWLVDLISLPAVSGFISGSAITITVTQLPPLLGIRGINTREAPYKVLIGVFRKVGTTKLDAALGVSALILLYLIKWGCASLAKRRPHMSKTIFFFSTLRTVVIIMLYVLVSFLVNRTHKESPSFRILGFIPRGLRPATPPHLKPEVMGKVLGSLPAAVIVLVIEHIAIAKSFGRLNNYAINPNSEFIAIGTTNLLGVFVGAYAATGSFSRTAINSKAGSRTPFAGVITAMLVIIALYTLTPIFLYVPQAALAAVIIHAIGDLITPPSTLYEFWRVNPLDVLIFGIGLGVIIFDGIEPGVYAMIGMSLAVQLFRVFKAKGRFLGRAKIHTIEPRNRGDTNSDEDSRASNRRDIFLPLNRHDGTNPLVELERPYPGIFIYRLTEGFNYPNANNHLDFMVKVIMEETRPTTIVSFAKPGDRPWNDPAPRKGKDDHDPPDHRPTLKAVILDFSSVNNVDVTSIQALIDTRNLLNKHVAPHTVQWHFACVHSRWTKRGLSAAGFGFPSFETVDGIPQHFKAVYSLAEHSDNLNRVQAAEETQIRAGKNKIRQSMMTEDIELGDFTTQDNKVTVSKVDVQNDGQLAPDSKIRMAAVHGMNRPYFHLDISSALTSAIAAEELRLAMSEQPEEAAQPQKTYVHI